jgi:hypothetical protein
MEREERWCKREVERKGGRVPCNDQVAHMSIIELARGKRKGEIRGEEKEVGWW